MADIEKKLEIDTSRQFTAWLLEHKLSLAFTTYQAGKLFLLGLQPDGKLSVAERTFERCMGLYANGNSLYMSSIYQIWRFENALTAGQYYEDHDALFVPQLAYTTGDIDVHDIVVDKAGQIVFNNTLFSCVATTSPSHSFKPLWKPPFISKLASEDRCHLNGLAMRDDVARYVTAVSTTDIHEGWREHRRNGGIVMDIKNNKILCEGLSMPHSPRWHDGKLWLHNSGTGEFGYIDEKKSKFIPLTFCPGYLRGLAFTGNFAIVGISKPRDNKTFNGLDLNDRLTEANIAPRCGLLVINLKSGDIVHSVNISGIVEEIYDVVVLPNIRRPMALGFKQDTIRRTITIDE